MRCLRLRNCYDDSRTLFKSLHQRTWLANTGFFAVSAPQPIAWLQLILDGLNKAEAP